MKEYVLGTFITNEVEAESMIPAIDLIVRVAERCTAVGEKRCHLTDWPDFDSFLYSLVQDGEVVEVTYALPSSSGIRRAKSLYFPAQTEVWITPQPK